MLNRKKYYAVFTIRQLQSHNVIGSKRINPTVNTVSFKKHTFVIDIENPSYIKNNKIYYFFSITSQIQLTFTKTKESTINAEVIDTIMTQKIVQQLTTNLDNEWKMNTSMILLGLIIGALTGYIVGQYLMINQKVA